MARRKASLFGISTGTNRNKPPAAQFGFGRSPRRGNVPFIDKPNGKVRMR